MLLEPVAAGQTRFRMQGLAPDARGIALGRELLLIFPSIDWLVAFLGAYSDEASLDELVPTMTLEHARRAGGGHALLMRCAAADGYFADRIARLCLSTRGELYTGAAAVFVRWRERDAPFGYDLVESLAPPADQVFVVDRTSRADYRAVDRIDPVELIQRLQLRPTPMPVGGIDRDPELMGLRDMALVLVAPGLASRVLGYLWRTETSMAGCYIELEADRGASLLLRVRHPNARIVAVLAGIPGVELLAPISSRAAVEVGFRHPISLASAQACFPGEDVLLFRGRVGRVERLSEPPRFVDGRHLVEAAGLAGLREVGQVRDAELAALKVDLSVRSSAKPREPRGTLVRWDQVGLLRHLVYLIPPRALAASRVVPIAEGVVVLTGSSLGPRGSSHGAGVGTGVIVPLGRRLCEVAPGVLLPEGDELWPRVRPTLLRELLGLGADDHAIFLSRDSRPIRVQAAQFMPLDAALLGRLTLGEAQVVQPALEPLKPASIRNDRMGRFALWGFGGIPPLGADGEQGPGQ